MAELTQQDLDNYNKLKKAFEKIPQTPPDPVLAPIKILIAGSVKNTEELSAIVNPLYSYWKVLSDLGIPLKFSDLEQQFSDSIENLKRSLKVVEDAKVDLTDEIEDFQPEALFLEFIKEVEKSLTPEPSAKTLTEKLINEIDPNLNESQIGYLTTTWGTAVSAFVEDARKPKDPSKTPPDGKVEPRQPETFAYFFRIHKELEILYSRLADSETVQ
jgi:hypothetical protein